VALTLAVFRRFGGFIPGLGSVLGRPGRVFRGFLGFFRSPIGGILGALCGAFVGVFRWARAIFALDIRQRDIVDVERYVLVFDHANRDLVENLIGW
jgi:hypothetical protein